LQLALRALFPRLSLLQSNILRQATFECGEFQIWRNSALQGLRKLGAKRTTAVAQAELKLIDCIRLSMDKMDHWELLTESPEALNQGVLRRKADGKLQ
jgi:hypothetical protein